jgi:chemotaxis protein CheZ
LLGGMTAVGDTAHKLLAKARLSLDDLQDSVSRTSADLITVSTAQDYQDLTGQIIQKIIVLLKDLEANLVNVIRTFGVRPDGRKDAVSDDLYGPAHAGRTSAMHSQDDVDSLLAGFGF